MNGQCAGVLYVPSEREISPSRLRKKYVVSRRPITMTTYMTLRVTIRKRNHQRHQRDTSK